MVLVADVPVGKNNRTVYEYSENCISESPSIKYRGIFINDEDWGMKTWAEKTFEKELIPKGSGPIGIIFGRRSNRGQ